MGPRVWLVPRATHSYFGIDSFRVDTMASYTKFVRNPSMEVSVRSGVAMQDIMIVTGVRPDQWRMKYLARLLKQSWDSHYRSDEEEVLRLSSLVDSLCCN